GRSALGSATRAIGCRAGTHADPKAAAQQRCLGDRLAHARLGATDHPLDLDARAALEPAHATTRLTARPVGLGLERLQVLLQRLDLLLEIGHRASLRVLASARRRRRAFPGPSETQRTHLVPEALDVTELDLLVAADQIGQTRELHGALVAFGRETDQRLLDERAILAGQLPLDPSHRGEAEGIERRAAQHLHPGEHAEDRSEPGAELELLLEAEGSEQRRVEVIGELRACAESSGAASTAPSRRRTTVRAHAGSATSSRPTRNAWLFIWTETPFRTIASSIAASLTGKAPACQAAPSTIMFAAMWSSKSV